MLKSYLKDIGRKGVVYDKLSNLYYIPYSCEVDLKFLIKEIEERMYSRDRVVKNLTDNLVLKTLIVEV